MKNRKDCILELQDLRYLDWTEKKMSPGTPGCFLKTYELVNDKRIYYKMSNYDSYRGIPHGLSHQKVSERKRK